MLSEAALKRGSRSSRGFNGSDNPDFYTIPLVTVGAGSNPVTGNFHIAGLTGTNITTAQNLLLDLSGSVSGSSALSNGFNVINPTDTDVLSARPGCKDYHQNEWGAFFKDDWKIRPNLTLNVGLRYDFYGVPCGSNGHECGARRRRGRIVRYFRHELGGYVAARPPRRHRHSSSLSARTPDHPDTLFYNNDRNNFGPAVGLSWSLPWGGKDKTVVRAGYGISYQGAASFNAGLSLFVGNNPGLSYRRPSRLSELGAQFFNFSSPNLPVPIPLPTSVKPLAMEPFDVRANSLFGFADNHRVNPYIQNFNFEIQRELAKNLTFEARYIGSKGTRLYGGISINDVNIYENGILDAFNITRAGGNAPLFDQMSERNHAECGNQRRPWTRRRQRNDSDRFGGVAREHHLQNFSRQRKCRSVRQRAEYIDDRDRQSRRASLKEWISRQLHRRESSICVRSHGHQSRQLDLPFDEHAGDQTLVAWLHQLICLHMEPRPRREQQRRKRRVSRSEKSQPQQEPSRLSTARMISEATALSRCRSDRAGSF